MTRLTYLTLPVMAIRSGGDRLRRWRTYVRHWVSVQRERAELAALDDRRLRDVGLDRSIARAEARRLPWDLPPRR